MRPRTFKKIILEDLKKQGFDRIASKIKSITYETFSMGNAVRVQAWDLNRSEKDTLDRFLHGYAYGRFDGMTDSSSSVFDETKERQAKFVTLDCKYSEPVYVKARAMLEREGITDDATAKEKYGEWFDTLLWRTVQGIVQ